MDIASISATLSSIKVASDIAKLIRESGLTLEQAELKFKLAELIGSLADAKMQIADVQLTLIEKDELIRELEKQLKTRGDMHWQDPFYFQIVDGKTEGPFCAICFDTSGKNVRLHDGEAGWWQCKACKNHFEEPDRRAADMTASNSPLRYPGPLA